MEASSWALASTRTRRTYLSGLGPYQAIDVTPSTEPLGLLPLALVATMAVPLAIALHIVSLRRLAAAVRAEQRTASAYSLVTTR